MGADDRVAGRLGEQAQPGRRLAARQRRHPHLEAGGLERRAGDGHQLPRLGLAQVHLAAAQAARAGAARAGGARGGPARRPAAWWPCCRPSGHLDRQQRRPRRRGRAPTGTRRRRCRAGRAARRAAVAGRAGDRAWPTGRAAWTPRRRRRPAPSNGEPSSRVMNASATAAAVRVVGGGAGSSSRPAASVTMASTTAPSTSRVVARASAAASAVTGPGMAAASRSSSASSTSAGVQRTARSRVRPSGPLAAVQRRDDRAPGDEAHGRDGAPGPSQATLAPTPSRPSPPPTATSQPSDSSTGIDSAAARTPVGSGTPGCRLQPSAGPPMASSRSASSSLSAGAASGPAAHTTTWPADPRRLQPHLAGRVGGRDGGRRGPAACGQQVVGRLEPGQLLLEVGDHLVALGARAAGGPRRGWSSVVVEQPLEGARQAAGSASSSASWSAVAVPSAAAHAAARALVLRPASWTGTSGPWCRLPHLPDPRGVRFAASWSGLGPGRSAAPRRDGRPNRAKATAAVAAAAPHPRHSRRVAAADAGGDQRPGALALDGERDVEQQLVGVVAGEHLHADGQAVDRARRGSTPPGCRRCWR